MEGVADGASEFVWTEVPAGCALGIGTAGSMLTSRDARTAASMAARTLLARRVRLTNGRSLLAPVVRTREPAVGPSASSSKTQAAAIPMKIAPAVEFVHCHRAAPRAANSTPGIIRRNSHERLGHTIMLSRSRK